MDRMASLKDDLDANEPDSVYCECESDLEDADISEEVASGLEEMFQGGNRTEHSFSFDKRHSRALTDYFREIGKFPLLSHKEQMQKIALGRALRGRIKIIEAIISSTENASLKNRRNNQKKQVHLNALLKSMRFQYKYQRDFFIKTNLRLVIKIANLYLGQGVPFEDIIQEGNIGVMRAYEKFDPSMGNHFSTYASWWIHRTMRMAVIKQVKTIRPSCYVGGNISRLRRAYEMLLHQGIQPTADAIASILGISVKDVERVFDAIAINITSLDEPLFGKNGKSHVARADITKSEYGCPEDATIVACRRKAISDSLSILDPRERRIIKMRFGLEDGETHTLEEISSEFGITRERIRQIEKVAINKLRSHEVLGPMLRSYLET